jgi:hypothetical protein
MGLGLGTTRSIFIKLVSLNKTHKYLIVKYLCVF